MAKCIQCSGLIKYNSDHKGTPIIPAFCSWNCEEEFYETNPWQHRFNAAMTTKEVKEDRKDADTYVDLDDNIPF